MGVFETIFRRPRNNLVPTGYFKMLNGYTPVFTNAPESVYEMESRRRLFIRSLLFVAN